MAAGMVFRGASRVATAAAANRSTQAAIVFPFASCGMLAGPICIQGRLFYRSFPLRLELNPSRNLYSMEHAFEEPTFRFICEGEDIDYREEVRAALLEVLAKKPSNFVGRTEETWMQENSPQRSVQLLRAVAKKQLLSFAQVKSTPRLFSAFFDVLASCSTSLALIAADHFTFAAMIAKHGTKEMQEAILDDVDTCRFIGTIAHRELIAEGVPLNSEARYDKDEKCFCFERGGEVCRRGSRMRGLGNCDGDAYLEQTGQPRSSTLCCAAAGTRRSEEGREHTAHARGKSNDECKWSGNSSF
ncbi:hypothetical protein C4B63_9g205 [Trypanosoma cruzi]|uniref:Uncharacterized protein n=1 Tax=Trypanosoma cruzi TaxID=5693 RepID=A0A2V2VSW6_TRYCR|nr:hypothetical protein C4B63_9g205 [Trypanosoma cruzi]